MSGGRLRLGVGWNHVEHQALGQDFHTRGHRKNRSTASEPVVDFSGRFHRIDRAALVPKPARTIPICLGGSGEKALDRAARLAEWLKAGQGLPGGPASYHRPVAVDVETSIEIECPRSMVAAFVSNPDNATQWYVNIQSITWETTPPAVVGSRIAFVAQFLGRRITYTYEVQEIAPRERFVMSTAQGPFPMQTTYSWQDTESGGTRMTLRNSGEPSGFGKMAAPMMAAAMRKANQKDLARLKMILENKT